MQADNYLKKLSRTSLLLAFSIILSIVEGMFPVTAIMPLPGVRLGLCNIAVNAALYTLGIPSALSIVIVRPCFMFLLSGNVVSFAMSLCGGLLSFASLLATKRLYGKYISFAGVSCISAVCHSIGQTLCGSIIVGSGAIFAYLPLFVCSSSIAGSLCGVLMNIVIPRMKKVPITAVKNL